MKLLLINIFAIAAMTVAGFADVLTYHNDNSRTGVNPFDTKFAVPTIFSKMVYVGTDHHVSVFGLK
jgi:hypothetical protein